MLRSIVIVSVLLVFAAYALRGPFEALIFYLWIAYFRPDAWLWDASLLITLKLSFSVGLYLIVRSLPRLGRAPLDLRGVLLITFFVISCASAWTSPVIISWNQWLDFGKRLFVSYLVYVLASESYEKLRLVVLTIALSLGLEAAKQGYVGLLLSPGGVNNNALPNLGDNNGVGVGMLMLSAILIALNRTAAGKWERRFHLFLLVGVLYRAITTYSRGTFLALSVMTVVYLLRSNQKFKAAFGACVIASILLPVLPQSFWNRMETMKVSSEEQMDTSSASRLHFWRVAIQMANDHPLLGVGYDGYERRYNDYDFSVGFYGRGRAVHSIWFGVLADLGYVALFVFLMMFVLSFTGMQKVVSLARAGTVPMNYYHLAIAFQTALVACAVGGSFLPWQYIEMPWHTFALTMALRHLALKTATPQAAPCSSPRSAPDGVRVARP